MHNSETLNPVHSKLHCMCMLLGSFYLLHHARGKSFIVFLPLAKIPGNVCKNT